MQRCKNDPNSSYSGKEPSPKGLGWCAHSETIGKKRRGNDGEMWIAAKRSNSSLYWHKIKETKPILNNRLSNFLKLPKENWKLWNKQLPGLKLFKKFGSTLEKEEISIKILILPVIWKNRDNIFNSIPYRDALIKKYPQLKKDPTLIVYIDLDKNANAQFSQSFTHFFNFTIELQNLFYEIMNRDKESDRPGYRVEGSIFDKYTGKVRNKGNSKWLELSKIEKMKKKYPFTNIRKDSYFIVDFFGKLSVN